MSAYDNRKHPRQDFRRPAFLRDRSGGVLGDCALSDISEGGARIAFAQTADGETPALPERFVLAITPDNKVIRFCELVWSAGREMGVRFLRPGSKAA